MLKLTNKHETSRGLSATAELLVWKLSNLVSCNWVFQSIHYWIPKIQDA